MAGRRGTNADNNMRYTISLGKFGEGGGMGKIGEGGGWVEIKYNFISCSFFFEFYTSALTPEMMIMVSRHSGSQKVCLKPNRSRLCRERRNSARGGSNFLLLWTAPFLM